MITYSQEALADVERLFVWLQARSPDAAARFVAGLRRAAARIAERPLLYLAAGDGSVRKCLMHFGGSAYVIYFQIEGADQVILRIWHGREERR